MAEVVLALAACKEEGGRMRGQVETLREEKATEVELRLLAEAATRGDVEESERRKAEMAEVVLALKASQEAGEGMRVLLETQVATSFLLLYYSHA